MTLPNLYRGIGLGIILLLTLFISRYLFFGSNKNFHSNSNSIKPTLPFCIGNSPGCCVSYNDGCNRCDNFFCSEINCEVYKEPHCFKYYTE